MHETKRRRGYRENRKNVVVPGPRDYETQAMYTRSRFDMDRLIRLLHASSAAEIDFKPYR